MATRLQGLSAAVILVSMFASSHPDMAVAQGDAFDDIDRMLDQQFNDVDAQLDENFVRIERAIDRAFKGLSDKIEVNWGDDIVLPTAQQWVTYDETMTARVATDFDAGEMTAEILLDGEDYQQAIQQLAQMMATISQASERDLDAGDSFLKELELELAQETLDQALLEPEPEPTPEPEDVSSEPVLDALIELPTENELLAMVEQVVEEPVIAEPVAEESVVASPLKAIEMPVVSIEPVAKTPKRKLKITLPFVNNFQETLMQRYMHDIRQTSAEFDISISTMLAIMETESSFNPRATSPIPAFGLMQVVPRTAGIDAYLHLYGEKKVVTPTYLYDELNNIKMGTAYFNLVMRRYLRGIDDNDSRFYCAIASYNTGVGNLAKTFVGSKDIPLAIAKINTMNADEVYQHLLQNLPADETKNYLRKIVTRKQKYRVFDEGQVL